jgi:hypothetical protein
MKFTVYKHIMNHFNTVYHIMKVFVISNEFIKWTNLFCLRKLGRFWEAIKDD